MRVRVEFDVEVPIKDLRFESFKDVTEWLRFSFRDNGVLDGGNQFIDAPEPEPIFGTFSWRPL